AGAEDAARAQFAVEVTPSPVDPVLCPTARQVGDSLTARMPGIVAASAPATGARTLRLALTQVGPNTVRLVLSDTADLVVLERVLDLGPRQANQPERPAAECAALADTVALIVERYLREIGYRPAPKASSAAPPAEAPPTATSSPRAGVPPSTTPAGRAGLFFGVGSNMATPITGRADHSQRTLSVELAGELHLRRIAFSASAGVGEATRTPPVPQTDSGTLQLLPMPLRLGAAVRVVAGPGYLLPRVGAGVDVLWISTTGIAGQHPGTAFEPVIEAGAAYLLPLGARFYVKVQALSVVSLFPHDFALGPEPAPFIFRTARAYVRGGLELGVAFQD
ncbi:MAG TPA: hypothetical protein VFH73_15945, partial [Polyangia bacterium]|nr:hypothetical protein [Polyangia bacterium]